MVRASTHPERDSVITSRTPKHEISNQQRLHLADQAAIATAQEVALLLPNETVILFGSKARGDHRPDSNIDLLILTGAKIGHQNPPSFEVARHQAVASVCRTDPHPEVKLVSMHPDAKTVAQRLGGRKAGENDWRIPHLTQQRSTLTKTQRHVSMVASATTPPPPVRAGYHPTQSDHRPDPDTLDNHLAICRTIERSNAPNELCRRLQHRVRRHRHHPLLISTNHPDIPLRLHAVIAGIANSFEHICWTPTSPPPETAPLKPYYSWNRHWPSP